MLDLSRPEVFVHVLGQITAVLSAYADDYVKWDHNRDLLEAGSAALGGAAAVHGQTTAFYTLLDTLRGEHPDVVWESCAFGGGRVDLGVLEKVQRVWTSDMTGRCRPPADPALDHAAGGPGVVGAHVSSPTSHTTGRTLGLDFRAGTALFGSFGIERDLTDAGDHELRQLSSWVQRFKRFRPLLHSGRVTSGVQRPGRAHARGRGGRRFAGSTGHVQLDEASHNRGVWVRVQWLDPTESYELRWEGPVDHTAVSMSASLPEAGPIDHIQVSGRALGARGFWMPRRPPETITLVHLVRA